MDAEELKARTRAFALRVVGLVRALPRNPEGEIMGRQVLRSATSVGANYRATCRAATPPIFRSKLAIVVEEADETAYWLELIRDAGLVKPEQIHDLLDEADQILRIMVSSQMTASHKHNS